MAHDVFISHSAKDKTTADAVCAMLESSGVRCWIAPRDVVPGMEWGECIIDAIEQSRIMVLVFSANANSSPQIRREIERAVNHDVAILPLRIENVLPGRALEFFIGNVHWLDAITPPLEAHLQNLAGTIKMLLARMELRDQIPEVVRAPETRDPVPPVSMAEPKASARIQEVPPMQVAVGPASELPETESDVSSAAAVGTRRTGEWQAKGGTVASRRLWRLPVWAWGGGAVSVALLVAVLQFMHTGTGASPGTLPTAMPDVPAGNVPIEADSENAPWVALPSRTTRKLESVFATSDGRHLWAVGLNGSVVASGDAGASWIEKSGGTTRDFVSIFGTGDGSRLWATEEAGWIVESDDGGTNWQVDYRGTSNNLSSIFAASDGRRIWAVGESGTILESENGGAAWTVRNSGTKTWLFSIRGTSDGKSLWAVGNVGTILDSENGGITWTAHDGVTKQDLYSSFEDNTGERLWAVGANGTIVESDDRGATWLSRSSGTARHLYSIFGAGDGNRLWIAGGLGTVVRSDDGGKTWTPRNSGTTQSLYSISGTNDGKNLWAVGDYGTILGSSR